MTDLSPLFVRSAAASCRSAAAVDRHSRRRGVLAPLCAARGPWHAQSSCIRRVSVRLQQLRLLLQPARHAHDRRRTAGCAVGVVLFRCGWLYTRTTTDSHTRTHARTHGHTDTHTVARSHARAHARAHARPQRHAHARARAHSAHAATQTRARTRARAYGRLSRVRRSSSASAQRCSTSGGTSSPTATSAPEGPTPATVAHASTRSTRAPVGNARLYRQPPLTAVQCRSTPDFTVQCRDVRAVPTVASGTSLPAVANRRGGSSSLSALCVAALRDMRGPGSLGGGGTAPCHGRLPGGVQGGPARGSGSGGRD